MRMYRSKYISFVLFLIVVVLLLQTSCYNTQMIYNQDYSGTYNLQLVKLRPSYRVYHHSITRSTIYFSVKSNSLLFAKPVNESNLTARFRIKYSTYSTENTRLMIDSGTFNFKLPQFSESDYVIFDSITIPVSRGNNYLVNMEFVDLNRNDAALDILNIVKGDAFGEQNYKLIDAKNYLKLNNMVYPREKVKLVINDTSVKRLYAKVFKRNFPLALPPFSIEQPPHFKFTADSIFELDVRKGSTEFTCLTNHALYFIQADTTNRKGVTLSNFGDSYPAVGTYEEMVNSLRYITMLNEYELLQRSKTKKESVDKFWLDVAGNKERARELIRAYYNRIQDANTLFSSFCEGWKTDRGIVYVIFGPPNYVVKNKGVEVWTYGELNNYRSLSYTFNKIDNPFTENDYVLDRNPLYKDEWMRAVDVWRQGRVYNPN